MLSGNVLRDCKSAQLRSDSLKFQRLISQHGKTMEFWRFYATETDIDARLKKRYIMKNKAFFAGKNKLRVV